MLDPAVNQISLPFQATPAAAATTYEGPAGLPRGHVEDRVRPASSPAAGWSTYGSSVPSGEKRKCPDPPRGLDADLARREVEKGSCRPSRARRRTRTSAPTLPATHRPAIAFGARSPPRADRASVPSNCHVSATLFFSRSASSPVRDASSSCTSACPRGLSLGSTIGSPKELPGLALPARVVDRHPARPAQSARLRFALPERDLVERRLHGARGARPLSPSDEPREQQRRPLQRRPTSRPPAGPGRRPAPVHGGDRRDRLQVVRDVLHRLEPVPRSDFSRQ